MANSRFRELLPKAVAELEERWHAGKLTPLETVEFCRRLTDKLNAADAVYTDRIFAIHKLAAADPAVIAEDIAELEASLRDLDNYKDYLFACDALLARTSAHPKLEQRVLAILARLLDDIERDAKSHPEVASYLGDLGTRAHWEHLIGRPLPAPHRRKP